MARSLLSLLVALSCSSVLAAGLMLHLSNSTLLTAKILALVELRVRPMIVAGVAAGEMLRREGAGEEDLHLRPELNSCVRTESDVGIPAQNLR